MIQSAVADEPLKTVNINAQPLGHLFGLANVSAEFGVSDTIALGPTVAYVEAKSRSNTVTYYGFGGSVDFFLNHKRFTDGIVLTLGLNYLFPTNRTLSASRILESAQFGYVWFWDEGFNIVLQGGIDYLSGQMKGDQSSKIQPTGGVQIGWVF